MNQPCDVLVHRTYLNVRASPLRIALKLLAFSSLVGPHYPLGL